MRWSSAATVVGLLLAPQDVWAAACCVGNTSTVPTRVGECERWTAGLGLEAEHTLGYWGRDGQLTESELSDDTLISTLAAGHRFDRDWQVGLVLPVHTNRRGSADDTTWGGGPGDMQVSATWDPVEERPTTPERHGAPVPLLTFGARLPTGTAWDESDRALAEDVTGRPGPALVVGAQLERATDRWPWSVAVATETELSGGTLRPALSWGGAAGRYLGPRWSFVGQLNQIASWSVAHDTSTMTLASTAGLRLVRGEPRSWRGWVGSATSIPIRHAGISSARTLSMSAGAVLVR